jgi:high-affinity iron transporter
MTEMIPALLITLREGLEAALIVGIILAYLAKTGNRAKSGAVWLGTGGSVVLSLLAGAAIFVTAGGIEGRAEEIFEGGAMFTAAAVLTYMIFWMRRQAINIRAHLQAQVQTALESGSLWALGLLAFVAVGREGVETALFLFAATKTTTPFSAAAGGLLGVSAAVVLGYLLYRGTTRLNLRAFFSVTSVLLLLFASGLLAHGVHEFYEAGLIPPLVETLWNTNAYLHEDSPLGSFLKALFGYNGNPSLVEVLAYTGYLLLVGWGYFRRPTARELRPSTERAR